MTDQVYIGQDQDEQEDGEDKYLSQSNQDFNMLNTRNEVGANSQDHSGVYQTLEPSVPKLELEEVSGRDAETLLDNKR